MHPPSPCKIGGIKNCLGRLENFDFGGCIVRGKFAWGVREFGLGNEKFAVYIIKTRKKTVKKISIKNIFILTLSVPIPDIERKSTHASLWCLKTFDEGL